MRPRWWVVRAWRWIVRAWRRLVRRWPAVGVRLVAGRHGWVPHQSIVGASSSQFGRTWGRDSHRPGETHGLTAHLHWAWFYTLFHNPSQKNKRFTFSFTHTAPTRYFLLVVRRAPPTSTQSQRNAQTPRTPAALHTPAHAHSTVSAALSEQALTNYSVTNPCVLTASCSIRLGSVPATVPAATAAVPAASSTSATQHAAASRHGAGLLLGSSWAPQAAA